MAIGIGVVVVGSRPAFSGAAEDMLARHCYIVLGKFTSPSELTHSSSATPALVLAFVADHVELRGWADSCAKLWPDARIVAFLDGSAYADPKAILCARIPAVVARPVEEEVLIQILDLIACNRGRVLVLPESKTLQVAAERGGRAVLVPSEAEPDRLENAPLAADWGGLLSPREKEVLHGIALGHSNKALGRVLGLTAKTVKVHTR